MKERKNYLDRIEIAAPCNASWEEMSGDERKRTCDLCHLNVYNISDMGTNEAESFLQQNVDSGNRVCVRLFRRHDGTIITDNCPVGLRKIRDSVRRVYKMVASFVAVLLANSAGARAQDASHSRPRDVRGQVLIRPVASDTSSDSEMGYVIDAPRKKSKPVHENEGQVSTHTSGTVAGPQPVLKVIGSMVSQATALASAHKELNSAAISALSSASMDSQCNKRELERVLHKFEERTAEAVRILGESDKSSIEQLRLLNVEKAISLVGEGNCLYYLGKGTDASDKYELALRCLEDLQFESKPAFVNRIFGNLNQAKRLVKNPLDSASLEEKLGKIPLKFSENGHPETGMAWLSTVDGKCDFTESLL